MSFLEVINIIVIILVIGVFLRYAWETFREKPMHPESWKNAVESGQISRELLRELKQYPDKVRFFNWWLQIERLRTENAAGAFAELGVYKGVSARIIHLMDPGRKFYLFDTFEGFPEEDLSHETGKAATYTPQNFGDTSEEKAKIHISGNDNLVFRKGYFPGSAKGLEDEVFSLVNMDADLYNPTRAGLNFFYPRLAPGGVILVHDYNSSWPGIVKAVDEFVSGIPESLIRIPDLEGTVMIIKNKT
jgi:O-methyltransferase